MVDLFSVALSVIAHRVLQPERIATMLDLLRAELARAQAPDRKREQALKRELALATEQMNSWYELVEERRVVYGTLKGRLDARQRRIDDVNRELADIEKRRQMPIKKFGAAQVEAFASAVRSELSSPGSKYAKGYLRAIVSEIRVGATGGRVTGSLADMAGAVSVWRPGAIGVAVPRHLSNWRGWRGLTPTLPLPVGLWLSPSRLHHEVAVVRFYRSEPLPTTRRSWQWWGQKSMPRDRWNSALAP